MKDMLKDVWLSADLGDLCRIELGSTPARKSARMWDAARETSNVWLSIADLPVGLHAIASDSKEYVSDEAAKGMKVIPEGTLMVSFKLTLGRMAYAGRDVFSNEAIAALHDIDEQRISKEFLYWALTAFDWQKAAEGDQKVKGKTLNKAKLKRIPIPLPPLEEQRRIVAVLDEAFAGLARARAHAEANLADARELFPSKVAEVFRDSGDWKSFTVADIGQVFDGPHATPKTVDEGPLFLGISSLVDGRIELDKTRHVTEEDFKTWTRRVEPRAGDVVFSYETRLGQVGLIPEGMTCCLGRRMGLVRLRADLVRPDFFVAYYLAPAFQELLRSKTVAGATVDRISIKDFPNFPVQIPSMEEQSAIIEKLAEFRTVHDEVVRGAETKLQDLDDLCQSLLQKAFSGGLS